jgi:hypothetical protein
VKFFDQILSIVNWDGFGEALCLLLYNFAQTNTSLGPGVLQYHIVIGSELSLHVKALTDHKGSSVTPSARSRIRGYHSTERFELPLADKHGPRIRGSTTLRLHNSAAPNHSDLWQT